MINSSYYKANYMYLMGNVFIREYDLAKANISALYECGIINEEQYQSYLTVDKHEREVEIGCYMKSNPELVKLIQDKIKEARELFINTNDIIDNQILYIDNDSITVIDHDLTVNRQTHFGTHLDFVLKNTYNLFFKLGSIDFLYSEMGSGYRLKYANTDKLASLHKDGFLDFLLSLAHEIYVDNILSGINMIKYYYKSYIDRQWPIEHYREFNNTSKYRLANKSMAYDYYNDITPPSLDDIDISYNANLLRLLMRILSTEYFKRN